MKRKRFDIPIQKISSYEKSQLVAKNPDNGNSCIQILIFGGNLVLVVPLFGVRTIKYHLSTPYKYQKILIFFT
jgi:hypothetical protein